MAQVLYRIGRWSVRRRRVVLGAWLAIAIAAVVAGTTLAGDTSDAFELPGTESQAAADALAAEMPSAGGASARYVFQAPDGATLDDPEFVEAIDAALATVATAPEVASATNPFDSGTVSPDRTVALATVSFTEPGAELPDATKQLAEDAAEVARDAGLVVEIGGDALAHMAHSSSAEMIGLMVAIVVLLITFGSVVAAGLPILTALIGVLIGMMGITAATGFLDMSSTAPTLAIMLGLAVGIDYALFIVTRHRQLMADGLAPEEAAARATGTAGSAVVFAGATVVIALLGLIVVGIPFLTVMGVAAAATVAGCVLIAITLVPALLGFAGTAIDRLRVPGVRVHTGLASGKDALGLRWGRFVVRHAAPVLVIGLLVVGVMAIPAASIEMGLPDDGAKSADTTERRAFDLLADAFGPGVNGPLIVTVDVSAATDPEAAASAVGTVIDGLDNVVNATPPFFTESGNFAIISVTPGSAPSDPETATLVKAIRAETTAVELETGAVASVTGTAAMNIDITDRLAAALPVYALVVVGLALVLLTMVFRSILVPIKATVGFLLSVGVSFGATVAVFQWGWLAGALGVEQTGPILSILPILLLGILFGLAMDYEVFLVSRIREDYVRSGDAGLGITEGVRHSSRVIVAAGLIMVAVFTAFVFTPDANVKMIGLALAVGVAADAFLVRMTIVPAVLTLLGDRAWRLPRWLDRIIPDIDIEGAALEAHLAEEPAAVAADDPADDRELVPA